MINHITVTHKYVVLYNEGFKHYNFIRVYNWIVVEMFHIELFKYTGKKLLPSAELLGCGHEIVLGEYMSCGTICLSGVQVFQEDIYYTNIFLREVMLCRLTCIMGGHILPECMSLGWHISQDDLCY